MSWNLEEKPILVFWETTRACDLACRHCRASAISRALPGELSHQEGLGFLEQVAAFGRPCPVLIMTGGDVLKRQRLWELLQRARELGLTVAVSPSVTPLLNEAVIDRLAAAGVSTMSLSLDGADAEFHDGLRGVPGTFARTLRYAEHAVRAGLRLQINTTVMKDNLRRLPELFSLIHARGAHIWEVFFLIATGRGTQLEAPSAQECEAVCHFLKEASGYGVTLRTVEAPFFRRVVQQSQEGAGPPPGPLAEELLADLRRRLGPPTLRPRHRSAQTRDGKGIVFVDYKGDVSPSGFLPVVEGNVRRTPLADIYRHSPLFRSLRRADSFGGRCGRCPYRDLCGGSRARAYACYGDPLAEDPACAYEPALAEIS
jgi:radical SAM protein